MGLTHHIEILDDPEQIPIKNNFYGIHKITHFYFYKKAFSSQMPNFNHFKISALNISEWVIAYIQNDARQDSLKKDLLSVQNYFAVNYNNLFFRYAQKEILQLENIICAFYDKNFISNRIGLNSLLRIFFNQREQKLFEFKVLNKPKNCLIDSNGKKWLKEIEKFANDYQAYYYDKYENKEPGFKPSEKYLNLVKDISNQNSLFLKWFYKAIDNTNEFLKSKANSIPDKWSDALLYNPQGKYALSFAKFAIKLFLLKQYITNSKIKN